MAPLRPLKGFGLPCMFFVICSLVLSSAGLSFAIGDLAVVVERVTDPNVDKCKYCGRHMRPGEIHKDAEIIVENQLKNQMTEKGIGFALDKKKPLYINVLIYRFEDRRGGNFAVEKPASVGFHMHLMEDAVVGKVFVFDEYQQALSQNVLSIGKFLKRGGKWVTSEGLSNEGIEAGLNYLTEGLE